MTLLIIVRYELEMANEPIDGILGAICPYLGTFGEQARVDSTERLKELRSGLHVADVTLLRVTLAGKAKADFSTLSAKLERFLKKTAKDAEVALEFELLSLVSSGVSAGSSGHSSGAGQPK